MTCVRCIIAIWVLVLAGGSGAVLAQEAPERALSLEDALRRAQAYNFQVQTAAAEARAARAGQRQTLATFLPRITVSEEGTATTDPVNAFGFKLKQEAFTQEDFAVDALNDPDRIDNFATKIDVQQPLVNPSGFFQRQAAAKQYDAAVQQQQRTEAFVTYRVKEGYFGLVLARERLAVLDSALVTARANRDQVEVFYDQGLVNRADLLAARVRVLELESQRAEADANSQNAADRLRYLLSIEENVTLVPTDTLERVRTDVSAAAIDVGQVNQQRSDMQALRYRADAARATARARRSAFLPTLNATGGYQWNDEDLFGTAGSSWTVGVALRWNLFSGFENIGAAQHAQANLHRAELAVRDQALQNQVDVAAALRTLEAARQQVRQAEAAVEQARESLRIRADRYAQDLEKTTDLLNAETTLANQRLAYLQALYQHNLTLYRLEWLTERALTP